MAPFRPGRTHRRYLQRAGSGPLIRSPLLLGSLLFGAGLLRYWIRYEPSGSVLHHGELVSLAENLYSHGSFANPFEALPTGPSAHTAPALPGLFFLLLKVFGDGGKGWHAIELAGVLITCLLVALLPAFSRVLGMGEGNGVVAGFFWIAAKIQLIPNWEGFYAAVLLGLACCCYRRYLTSPPEIHGLASLLGCLIGLQILLIPSVVPVFAAWVAWAVYRRRRSGLAFSLGALILLPTVIITPWMIRNYRTFNRIFWVRDNLGLELQISNNDCARFGASQNNISRCFFQFHPNVNPVEAAKVLEAGEAEYNRLKGSEALRWVIIH